jgi:mannose-6-phosphate isomerase-like protein (cupin superfamily)
MGVRPSAPWPGLVAETLRGSTIGAPTSELVLVEWTAAAGPIQPRQYVAPLHVHHSDDEAWYVVDGRLGVRLGDEEMTVPTGGAVLAPRGVPHTYWNAQEQPTRYVLAMTPRIQRLIDALHAEKLDADGVTRVFAEHDSAYLGWP